MFFYEHAWSIVTPLFSGLTFCLGLLIKGKIDHRLAKSLEKLRADIRLGETNAVSAREDVAAVRKMLMDRASNRTNALQARRFQAIDIIWASLIELDPFRVLGEMMLLSILTNYLSGLMAKPRRTKSCRNSLRSSLTIILPCQISWLAQYLLIYVNRKFSSRRPYGRSYPHIGRC